MGVALRQNVSGILCSFARLQLNTALSFMFLPIRKCNLPPCEACRNVARRHEGRVCASILNADLFRRHGAHFSLQVTCHVFIIIIAPKLSFQLITSNVHHVAYGCFYIPLLIPYVYILIISPSAGI